MQAGRDAEETNARVDEIAAYIMARRAARLAQLSSILNFPNGAYISVALVAVAAIVANGWADPTPFWLVAAPVALLLAGFAMKTVFGALMLYERWQRWREHRKDGGWP